MEPVYPLWRPKNEPQKTISTLRKSLFSYQTDKPISFVLNVLQVGHLRTLFLIKYGVIEEKHGYFIKKKYATTP